MSNDATILHLHHDTQIAAPSRPHSLHPQPTRIRHYQTNPLNLSLITPISAQNSITSRPTVSERQANTPRSKPSQNPLKTRPKTTQNTPIRCTLSKEPT